MANDVWSLGIILLNLATGRNPWKSATPGDPTFQAYLRDPMNFLPSVLPISPEINEILVRMLDVDFRERMTLREVRYAIEEVNSFYSDGVVFEGSMARCPWEQGMEIDSSSSGTGPEDVAPQSPPAQPTSQFPEDVVDAHAHLGSHWSKDSTSEIAFAAHSVEEGSSYGAPWTTYSCGATWAFESSISSDSEPEPFRMDLYDRSRTPALTQSPSSSLPPTPNSLDTTFGARLHANATLEQRSGNVHGGLGLIIDTNISRPRIYGYDAADPSIQASYSNSTSIMHTAIEYDPYSSMYYINSPIPHSPEKGVIVMPDSALTAVGEDKEMTSPSVWTSSSATEMSSPSSFASSSPSSSIGGEDLEFRRSSTPSPEPYGHALWATYSPSHQSQVQCTPPQQCALSSTMSTSMTDVVLSSSRLRPTSPFTAVKSSKKGDTSVASSVVSPPTAGSPTTNPSRSPTNTLTRIAIKLFPRPSSPTPAQASPVPEAAFRRDGASPNTPRASPTRRQTAPATPQQAAWGTAQVGKDDGQRWGDAARDFDESNSHRTEQQQQHQLRSTRHWFLPGRFRTSTGGN